jgi:hypothetical protein
MPNPLMQIEEENLYQLTSGSQLNCEALVTCEQVDDN